MPASAPPLARILLGISGGIAAYKSAELTRLLMKGGYDVQVLMSEAATRFITPLTLQALSSRPVFVDAWDARIDSHMPHIDLSRGADLMLVAPASADYLAKLAHGTADDLISTTSAARACPLLVAPAMNQAMWRNPANLRNIAQIEADGVIVLGPDAGEQACGETGLGRMLEPEVLFAYLEAFLQPKSLRGLHVLLTAGPTFERIDPVRGLTNASSGRMGFALAQAAFEAGASVMLVSGPCPLPTPLGIERIDVENAVQMHDAVMQGVPRCDIFIGVAAVADYTVNAPAEHKLKKEQTTFSLHLSPTRDILARVAGLASPPFCVGFAAESDDVIARAEEKRQRKRLPLLVANHASAIGAPDNQVTLLDDAGAHPLPRAPKLQIARAIVLHLAQLYANPPTGSR